MARQRATVALPPWKFIAFSDLHVSATTIDICMRVLEDVRVLAKHHGARVVFLGDFWDARGILSVRHTDRLITEFDRWAAEKIEAVIIPGNHDQVTVDGTVHGVRIFDPYRNITIATERVLWAEDKLAFIPWREKPEEQAALFDLPGDGWTIFAHAEMQGAKTNYGHEAVGRVTIASVEAHARACYLGHYHLRQQLGDRSFYIGNPYEKNIGERGQAKGCALITPQAVEPAWFDLPLEPPLFRRFFRFDYPAVPDPTVLPQDIVEVRVPIEDVGSEEYAAYCARISADVIRDIVAEAPADENAPPVFALSLDAAIDVLVENTESLPEHVDAAMLAKFGRSVLGEIPEARSVEPMFPLVEVLSVKTHGFCGLAREVELDLEKRGLVLLSGPIATGKTALVDAVTWALYDKTSPRKPGAHGATFRGDEVIHDGHDHADVEVRLRAGGKVITVLRQKERGKGSRVSIDGIDTPDGIADQQELIDRIVGLSYPLWRIAVSLGQGAVGSFVTDADKRRKELLGEPFGLSACPAAQKFVRARLKPQTMRRDHLALELSSEQRLIDALTGQDFSAQIEQWDFQRQADIQAVQEKAAKATTTITQIDEVLAGEQEWLASRQQHMAHVEKLTSELASIGTTAEATAKEREIGAVLGERRSVDAQLAKARAAATQLEEDLRRSKGMACPTCGQAMPTASVERMTAEKLREVTSLEGTSKSLVARLANMEIEAKNLRAGGEQRTKAIEAELAESRTALASVAEALVQFTRLRSNRDEAAKQIAEAHAQHARLTAEVNPFKTRQDALVQQIEQHRTKIEHGKHELQTLDIQIAVLGFWDNAFGPKGLPALVLRTALFELTEYANHFLSQLLQGSVFVQLTMLEDDLGLQIFERDENGAVHERRYEVLSGGQRRCLEMAFSPFAISEMIFKRSGVRVPLMIIDELTTHLGQGEKPLVCELLRTLDRDTILVIDHDPLVQGEFETVITMSEL